MWHSKLFIRPDFIVTCLWHSKSLIRSDIIVICMWHSKLFIRPDFIMTCMWHSKSVIKIKRNFTTLEFRCAMAATRFPRNLTSNEFPEYHELLKIPKHGNIDYSIKASKNRGHALREYFTTYQLYHIRNAFFQNT